MKLHSCISNIGFALIAIVFTFSGCSNSKKKHSETSQETPVEVKQVLETGKVTELVSGSGSDFSYYIPESTGGIEKYPVIIFLDPHGDGKIPVEKYKNLADKFQFILVGSNESKNGKSFDEILEISSRLLKSVTGTLPVNTQQIALAGFSGGAKGAIVCGNSLEGFNTIIYSGAAIPPNNIQIKTPLIAFAGNKDMNYTEVKSFNFSLENTGIPHTLVEWNGKHEWPDTSAFEHAFYWNIFTSHRKSKNTDDKKSINDFRKMLDASIKDEKNILVKALLFQEGIDMLQEINPVNNYKILKHELVQSITYKNQLKKQERILENEEIRKKELVAAFDNRELPWWKNQVEMLQSDKNNVSNQRLLGYISLAAWSFSSKAVSANDSKSAMKSLTIYKLADPENSEQPFLTACLYSKNNKPDSAMIYLNEAVRLGLNDKSKLENQQDFLSLRGRSDFRELLGKMR